jgi:hypothetical protein
LEVVPEQAFVLAADVVLHAAVRIFKECSHCRHCLCLSVDLCSLVMDAFKGFSTFAVTKLALWCGPNFFLVTGLSSILIA